MDTVKELAEQICEIGKRVYRNGFVAANDGNISVRYDDTSILTTPTATSKGFMTPEMIIHMSLGGKVLSNSAYKPSSEVKMHLAVYRENPDVNAVVHTHAPAATMLAVMHEPIERAYLPESVVLLGNVPVAEFALPGSERLGELVAPLAKTYNAALLANHGAVTWGADLQSAYFLMETLEYYAKIVLWSELLPGRAKPLGREQMDGLMALHDKLGYSKGGYPVSE